MGYMHRGFEDLHRANHIPLVRAIFSQIERFMAAGNRSAWAWNQACPHYARVAVARLWRSSCHAQHRRSRSAKRLRDVCLACQANTGARTRGVLDSTSRGELVLSRSKEYPRTFSFRLAEKAGHITVVAAGGSRIRRAGSPPGEGDSAIIGPLSLRESQVQAP
jgi:hypothetical protein